LAKSGQRADTPEEGNEPSPPASDQPPSTPVQPSLPDEEWTFPAFEPRPAAAPVQEPLAQVPQSSYTPPPKQAGSEEELAIHTLDPRQTRRLPRLRVIGQLSQSYIITEAADGMYLIDQHAAHERILLERMVAALKARTPISQLLLTPISLTLSPGELEAIEEHIQQLAQIGFSLEIIDGKTLEVRAVPSVLVKQMNARSLHELLIDLTAAENLGHTETWEEHALANVACKAAIKQNYFLTIHEMHEMIEQLEQTMAPYSCCHGRPTMVHFSLSALANEFGRR
jgi:DNA mismatch repair protein MutL